MKQAFTLLELIFVLVIIGVLTKMGFSLFRPHYLDRDASFISMQIQNAHYHGIGLDHRSFGGGYVTIDNDQSCLEITKTSLEASASNSGAKGYTMHSDLSGDLSGDTLCFDHFGRPGLDNHNKSNLISEKKSLTLKYGQKERNITIYPKSGYVTIN